MNFDIYGFLKRGPYKAASPDMCIGTPLRTTLDHDGSYPDSLKLTFMIYYKNWDNGECLEYGTQTGFVFTLPSEFVTSQDMVNAIKRLITLKDVMDMVLRAWVKTSKALEDHQIPVGFDMSPKFLEEIAEPLLRMIKLPPIPPTSLN